MFVRPLRLVTHKIIYFQSCFPEKLNEIEFVWKPFDEAWNKMFFKLKEYEQINGHCEVPQKITDNKFIGLGRWVTKQRRKKRKKKLSADRIKKLEQLVFNWGKSTIPWEIRYQELAGYKSKHGHCDILRKRKDNTSLAIWVHKQKYTKYRLTPERLKKLEALEFEWSE